jgi:hypothetical protein
MGGEMSDEDRRRWGLSTKTYEALIKRANELSTWAQGRNLTYYYDDPWTLHTYPFAFFRLTFKSYGVKAGAHNVMVGKRNDVDVYVFDWMGVEYWSGGEDPSPVHGFRTCVMVPLPGSLPATMFVRKKVRWASTKIPKKWGFQEFGSGDPAFDKLFKMYSVHAQLGRWLVNPHMKEWLVSRGPDFALEINQQNMLLISEVVPLEQMDILLDFATGLINVFPPETWKEYPVPEQQPMPPLQGS